MKYRYQKTVQTENTVTNAVLTLTGGELRRSGINMPLAFHNTIELTDEELKRAEKQAKTQEGKILEFFKQNPTNYFTPYEIHRALFSSYTPITSIRRAMTDLEHSGPLIKTTQKKKGSFAQLNFCWCLNPYMQVQEVLF